MGSTFSTAFCKVERRPSNQTVSSTASHRPSNIPFAWFILFERNRQAWARNERRLTFKPTKRRKGNSWRRAVSRPAFQKAGCNRSTESLGRLHPQQLSERVGGVNLNEILRMNQDAHFLLARRHPSPDTRPSGTERTVFPQGAPFMPLDRVWCWFIREAGILVSTVPASAL